MTGVPSMPGLDRDEYPPAMMRASLHSTRVSSGRSLVCLATCLVLLAAISGCTPITTSRGGVSAHPCALQLTEPVKQTFQVALVSVRSLQNDSVPYCEYRLSNGALVQARVFFLSEQERAFVIKGNPFWSMVTGLGDYAKWQGFDNGPGLSNGSLEVVVGVRQLQLDLLRVPEPPAETLHSATSMAAAVLTHVQTVPR